MIRYKPKKVRRENSKYRKGIQKTFMFKNGYGASIIRFKGPDSLNTKSWRYTTYTSNYKEWELAVIHQKDKDDWVIDYGTHITKDVMGHLNDEQVNKILDKIKAFPKYEEIV